jgi:NADH:ubiquinone oxidoreductase subunit 5 (subunit L)/multisubunit Na+/H+ antiporter MnhA subunit
LTAAALSLALLGLGGIPPLAGFMSEWQIFVAGFATRSLLISGLVIFAALNSLLSLAYYVPIVNVAYRQEPSSCGHTRAIHADCHSHPYGRAGTGNRCHRHLARPGHVVGGAGRASRDGGIRDVAIPGRVW